MRDIDRQSIDLECEVLTDGGETVQCEEVPEKGHSVQCEELTVDRQYSVRE